ncbi:MAG: response regulator [Aphanothece sp. CMT-3BRIN-NPC111]|jgi:CheY-like chemotaxis protein|nr:response regulator [Aphanothece sp. CMT-3BRIN-NPC111]
MTNRRILVIDDETDIQEVVQLCLEITVGWTVMIASSGTEGLLVAEAEQPNGILLDVMMPDLDGSATFAKLQAKASTRDIPVVLLTAKLQPADRRRFDEIGVKGIIEKPFDPVNLANQIAELLEWEL